MSGESNDNGVTKTNGLDQEVNVCDIYIENVYFLTDNCLLKKEGIMAKKIWSALVVGAVLVSAMALTVSAEENKTVGKVSFNLNEAYHQAECQWFEQYAKEDGYETIILDGAANAETMLNNVTDLIASGVAAIFIQPSDNSNAETVVTEAQAAGMPIATFVNPSETPSPHVVLAESYSSEELGKRAAEKWLEWYPDSKIIIAVVDYPASEQVHNDRALSFVAGVQSVQPEAEVAVMLDGEASRDKSMACGEDILQAHPEVNMVYGINANTSLGVLAAFEAAGRGKAVDGVAQTEIIVGTDGTEQEALKLYDPNSSYKLTQGLSPKNFAKVEWETTKGMIDGTIDPTSEYRVEVSDTVFDYWSTPIEEFQEFLTNEYFSEMDVKAELGLE